MRRSGSIYTPEFARYWAEELGSSQDSLIRLKGGANNYVYRCGDKHLKVIKGYSLTKHGLRDGMQAEVDFLRYAEIAAPRLTPKLIHVDIERRCIVIEHIEGYKIQEGTKASKSAIQEAVNFFRQLNLEAYTPPNPIKMSAAEGFLNIYDHVENIKGRLKTFKLENMKIETRLRAANIISQITNRLHHVEEGVGEQIKSGKICKCILPEERCISPSDFGFHNAIISSTGLKFIDFEFAGWDDPAKALVDFILQPRVPVESTSFPLLEGLTQLQRKSVVNRCKALKPILHLKWTCIILAILQPDRALEISRIMPEEKFEHLLDQRIQLASLYLKKYTKI